MQRNPSCDACQQGIARYHRVMDVTQDQASAPHDSVDVRCDVLVVGGGINGAGVARDLAGRGWSVVLCEQHDLAQHTSSASTKLIHGGLRYLEHRAFGLVRKALIEREGLLRGAPHIMWPLRFVLPHDEGMRPGWMIQTGLWLYDHLAPRDFLPPSGVLDLSEHPAGQPLKPVFQRGYVYSDGWVDDARLVVACAQDARNRGANVLTRTRCDQLQATPEGWSALLSHRDALTDRLTHHLRVQARLVVNAAGPWADKLQGLMDVAHRGEKAAPPEAAKTQLRLVKGSHIVVPRLFQHEHAYIFQQPDGRIVFAIPYEQQFTLIGTTDVDHGADPDTVACSPQEVSYLCDAVNRYFRRSIAPHEVVWQFSGVRPLLQDANGKASAVTRDYRLDQGRGQWPWITVWGGKITTFRKLADQVGNLAGELLDDRRPGWTLDEVLPGGRLVELIDAEVDPVSDMAEFKLKLRQRFPWMDTALARRWSHQYGDATLAMLRGLSGREGLGAEVAPGLYEAELFHLQRQEWAQTADDVLWRRSKLGLHYNEAQRQAVADWFARAKG
jgi:glycerol-3-phosphate dehydrogenase